MPIGIAGSLPLPHSSRIEAICVQLRTGYCNMLQWLCSNIFRNKIAFLGITRTKVRGYNSLCCNELNVVLNFHLLSCLCHKNPASQQKNCGPESQFFCVTILSLPVFQHLAILESLLCGLAYFCVTIFFQSHQDFQRSLGIAGYFLPNLRVFMSG